MENFKAEIAEREKKKSFETIENDTSINTFSHRLIKCVPIDNLQGGKKKKKK